MSTLENNKTLALFMGEDYRDNRVVRLTGNICLKNPKGELHYPIDYHKSWDWLIPVVEKIEKLPCVGQFEIVYDGIAKLNRVVIIPMGSASFEINVQGGDKIATVYFACIDFIKWYNLQNA